jgi:hypothetical protein
MLATVFDFFNCLTVSSYSYLLSLSSGRYLVLNVTLMSVEGQFVILYNQELGDVYRSPNMVRIVKYRKLR